MIIEIISHKYNIELIENELDFYEILHKEAEHYEFKDYRIIATCEDIHLMSLFVARLVYLNKFHFRLFV